MITLLLVDDAPTVRRGLRMGLSLEADLRVVGEAGDAAGALRLAALLDPDVVVMDVELPGMDGVVACERLRAAGCRCAAVILSIHEDRATRERARAAGAAFVSKHEPVEALLAAIRAEAQGGEAWR
jgi:DNA-binding NarL/FixJ family response regulator